MSKERFNNSLLREQKIVIPNRFLNNQLREKISRVNYSRAARMIVFPAGVAIGETLRRMIGTPLLTDRKESIPWVALAGGSALGFAVINPKYAKRIQTTYKELDFSQPLFSTQHEHEFPKGWMSPGVIKETHPIYYIDLHGNLVFAKPSRMEYYRYLYQQKLLGRLGYHTWYYRGYLTPPKVPESVKKWATAKLHKTMEKMRERMRPSPAPKPATVPMGMRASVSRARATRNPQRRAR